MSLTPKIVFSRILEKAGWNTRVVSGQLADEVVALKRQPGGQHQAGLRPRQSW